MGLEELSPQDVGDRLRLARDNVGLTQVEVATKIDVARTTLLAIEKGQRRIRPEELQQLCRLYNTSVNAVLRREAVYVDLVPRFRRLGASTDAAANAAATLLGDLVRAEVELENLLGIRRERNDPPKRPIMPGDVRIQAENDATELRQWLGLGFAPVRDLVSLLELDLGVRVYVRPLDSRVSGLFAYDDELGACMLLNAKHPRERRTQSGGHELGHLVSTRDKAEILHINEDNKSREERYANAFGRAFLTPARTVMRKFHELTAGASRLTRRHVILMAHAFGVSREAMVRRLEELELTKLGTWDWFVANGGITDAQAQQVLGDLFAIDADGLQADRPTTLRLNLLAAEAWQQNLLSEGQLARLLHLDRITARKMLDSVGLEGSEADVLPKLPE
ncbi:MAG: XRE family transcriptional regulator [Deltaproteobacteria bacterium]|nr:XRE family transcriptional regulator [Deltaproteobacteria bacterium]